LERNSLEYLLNHFCEITANKEYVVFILSLTFQISLCINYFLYLHSWRF